MMPFVGRNSGRRGDHVTTIVGIHQVSIAVPTEPEFTFVRTANKDLHPSGIPIGVYPGGKGQIPQDVEGRIRQGIIAGIVRSPVIVVGDCHLRAVRTISFISPKDLPIPVGSDGGMAPQNAIGQSRRVVSRIGIVVIAAGVETIFGY